MIAIFFPPCLDCCWETDVQGVRTMIAILALVVALKETTKEVFSILIAGEHTSAATIMVGHFYSFV